MELKNVVALGVVITVLSQAARGVLTIEAAEGGKEAQKIVIPIKEGGDYPHPVHNGHEVRRMERPLYAASSSGDINVNVYDTIHVSG